MKLERFKSLLREYGIDKIPEKGTVIFVKPAIGFSANWHMATVAGSSSYLLEGLPDEEPIEFEEKDEFFIP